MEELLFLASMEALVIFYFFALVSQNCSMLTVSASTDASAEGHLRGRTSKPRSEFLPGSPPMVVYFWREKRFADRSDLIARDTFAANILASSEAGSFAEEPVQESLHLLQSIV